VAHAAFAQVAQPGLARVLHRVLTPSLRLPWHPTPNYPTAPSTMCVVCLRSNIGWLRCGV
jgi:hypothetical protein